MSVLTIIRGEALTNSAQDKWARVDIKIDGICDKIDKVPSIGGSPIKKGDEVYVYHPDAYTFLVLGRSIGEKLSTSGDKLENGCSVIFDQNDGTDWSKMIACPNKVTIENSKGAKVIMEGDTVSIKSGKVRIDSNDVKFNNGTSPWLYSEKLIAKLEQDTLQLNLLAKTLKTTTSVLSGALTAASVADPIIAPVATAFSAYAIALQATLTTITKISYTGIVDNKVKH